MLPRNEFDALPNEMKILHENIRQLELNPDGGSASYYTVKVLEGLHFVERLSRGQILYQF